MNLQEMIKSVRSNLNEEDTTGFYSNEEIQKWLNDGLNKFVLQVEPNSMQESQYIKTSGQIKYELPGDFLKEYMVEMNGNKIDRISMEDKGDKKGYYIWGDDIHISKEEKGVELIIYYYSSPITLKEETSIPKIMPQHHNTLVNYATYKALQKDKKIDLAQFYKRDFREDIMSAVKFNKKPAKRRWEIKRI
jgi:hypothetical protein